MMRVEDYNPVQQYAELHALVVEMVDTPGGELIPKGMEWLADRQTLSKKFAHRIIDTRSLAAVRATRTLRAGTANLLPSRGSGSVLNTLSRYTSHAAT